MFAGDGELVADYQIPLGKPDVPAAFPDTPKAGLCSLFNCRTDGLLSTAEDSDKTQLNSTFKAEGCPLGYAYGLQGGRNLGFFADYPPAKDMMEESWRPYRLFSHVIPAEERKEYLPTHPDCHL